MGKVKPENEWKFKCANTGKAIKRRKRYYRNGKYYITKAAFQAQMKKEAEEKAKVAAEKQAAEAKAAAEKQAVEEKAAAEPKEEAK